MAPLNSAGQLATLTYRSNASPSFSPDELGPLLEVSRVRNRAASVTGLLIYDDGRFFQWLEGPPDKLDNVWNVIRRDPRHTDVEVLDHSPTSDRVFGQWDMKLASKAARPAVSPDHPVVLSPELVGALFENPAKASSLLAKIPAARAGIKSIPGDAEAQDRKILRTLVEHQVVPTLVARHRSERPRLPLAHPRAAELAQLLVAADPADAFALLDLLQAEAGSIALTSATVSEPAARSLGELWARDDCAEVDVVLGLGRLHAGIHRVELGPKLVTTTGKPLRAVLVAPQPGEVHMLGAALDAEVLWRDGWDIQCEFPDSDAALSGLVSKQWFDAIDLSLSTAFRRDHWLPRMAQTIALARRASLNPEIVVVVGGRVFYEHGANAATVGADADSMTALHISQTVRKSIQDR